MNDLRVPPFLFAKSGTFASPVTYTVPGSGEVQPYTSTATYANNSGGAIRPALRIKSQSENLLALVFPSDTIANGASSEVSFVPPFGSAAASSGGTATATADYALASLDCTATLFANGFIQMFPADYLAIGNPAMFQDDGSGRIQIIATGLYEITWTVQLYSSTLPAANTPNIIERFISTSTPNQITLNDPGTFAGFPGSTVGTATNWNVWETGWIDLIHPSVSVYMTIFGGGVTHALYGSATATVRIVRLTEASAAGL